MLSAIRRKHQSRATRKKHRPVAAPEPVQVFISTYTRGPTATPPSALLVSRPSAPPPLSPPKRKAPLTNGEDDEAAVHARRIAKLRRHLSENIPPELLVNALGSYARALAETRTPRSPALAKVVEASPTLEGSPLIEIGSPHGPDVGFDHLSSFGIREVLPRTAARIVAAPSARTSAVPSAGGSLDRTLIPPAVFTDASPKHSTPDIVDDSFIDLEAALNAASLGSTPVLSPRDYATPLTADILADGSPIASAHSCVLGARSPDGLRRLTVDMPSFVPFSTESAPGLSAFGFMMPEPAAGRSGFDVQRDARFGGQALTMSEVGLPGIREGVPGDEGTFGVRDRWLLNGSRW